MADLTVYAEALISTVARAFYEDEAVCLIDVLIRDKFLRDDDMAPRLSLPAKRLRSTLQFLTDEHLVRSETVDDLAQGGSQTTKFYYLDYNRAVHSIRLRVQLLRKKLQADEMRARSSSFYLCPGYKQRRCNGRYTEEEAQQKIDLNTGLFLCRTCFSNYENDPHPPPMETYTLRLVDNEKDLREAVDNLRRLNVQLSAKFIGSQQLRPGIYDLLQKVRGGAAAAAAAASNKTGAQRKPITSNLPSENFALGIGSTRLAGTGRTAGIKITKLQKQGLAESAAQAKNYLVGGDAAAAAAGQIGGLGAGGGPLPGSGWNDYEALMFLKSAHGHEIQFTVERGGGARAQVLATPAKRTRRRKLMDAAASRVGASLPIPLRVQETLKRQQEQMQAEAAAMADDATNKRHKKNSSKNGMHATLYFLKDNIGRAPHEWTLAETAHRNAQALAAAEDAAETMTTNGNSNNNNATNGNRLAPNGGSNNNNTPELIVDEETETRQKLSPEERIVAFQQQYKAEMKRQEEILHLCDESNTATNKTSNDHHMSSPTNSNNNNNNMAASPNHHAFAVVDEDDDSHSIIAWEDGDLLVHDSESGSWHAT